MVFEAALVRDSKEKCRALTNLGFGPYFATALFDYFFADGEADSGAWKLASRVQALEHIENSARSIIFDPDPIIFHLN